MDFFAEIQIHSGANVEIDVATFESEGELEEVNGGESVNGGVAVATAVYAPPRPTLTIASDLPTQDVYEVRIYDERRRARLVAAIEIVSPGNKDRPEHRQAFVAKCASLLSERVCVVVVDPVTTRTHNLYAELLDLLGLSDPGIRLDTPLYTAVCRMTKRNDEWTLETWTQSLTLGQPLPTLPLWIADDRAVPLELEASYEQSCSILGIP